MSRDERRLGAVPGALWLLLGAALAGQLAWQAARRPAAPAAADLPPAPSVAALRLASFGEPQALARIAMLYLQSFDLRAGNTLRYAELDYARLEGWLAAILELDPKSTYPLFSAARVYAEVDDPRRCRIMLEFVYREFLRDPNGRWQWLAHAALLAKHRLHDLPLARRYAAAVQRYTTDPRVPLWAKQMEIFILEDMNELEAAKIMLGGLLESGAVHDPDEARFLAQHLKELEGRTRPKARK
ncbi:MAG TPA: hypothetical protein VF262_02635 [Burkholderiales bacterium]